MGAKVTEWMDRHGLAIEREIRFAPARVFLITGRIRCLYWYDETADMDKGVGPYVSIRNPYYVARRVRRIRKRRG